MTKMNISRLGRIYSTLIILMLLAGCSGLKNKEEMPAEDLAKKGLEQYNHGKYFLAVETFNIIKERFPFSRFSLLAELKSADSKFYMKDYAEAVELYRSFEENHPTHEAIPYVIFQIGRSHYRTIDTIDRDTSGAHAAIKVFARLLRTFPNSPYTEEAKVLSKKANNFLAEHELGVANFYLRTKEFGQAKGRAEYLLSGYPDSPAAAQAKEMLNKIEAAEKTAGE
ncbi:MAG: outer membrane protein assembly factor BamD [Thermodesulfobacteriota bacterium]